MQPLVLSIAHITDDDGNFYQVLNEAGDDWDEVATRARYDASTPTHDLKGNPIDDR